MKKLLWSLILGLLLLTGLYAASQPKKTPPKVITDQAGRTVTLSSNPVSIVSLSPSNTEILFAIGAGELVKGVTDFCNFPAEAQSRENVGGFADISVEKILALNPDYVFAANLHATKLLPVLEQLGLRVVVTDPQNVEQIFEAISLAGELTGFKENAQKLVSDLRRKKDDLAAKTAASEKKTVFWELSNDLWTVGPNTFINDLIILSGGKNIAEEAAAPWIQISSEVIIQNDPDTIVLADHTFGESHTTLTDRPGWKNLKAVIDDKILEVNSDQTDILSRPGPRIIEALEILSHFFHPELFN